MSFSTWWTLSAGMVSSDKEESGVYELGDDQERVIYIGRADDIKARLTDHVNEKDNDCIKKNAKKYRIEYTSKHKAREKELYDEYVRINGKAPSCNKITPTG